MARRDHRVKAAIKAARNPSSPSVATAVRPEPEPEGDDSFAKLGELLRRFALGLAGMLFVVRAYYPSEDAESGSGLVWIFAVLAIAAVAVAASLFSGTFRVRWSWADAAVLVLMLLVASSASHAADRRPAITMAWEWGALGVLYFLVRNLPRTRAESATLAGVVVLTAVAVAAYGLYQIPVEFTQIQAMFEKNPNAILARMNIEPGSPAAVAFENRLMGSNEPYSTFALPNSLAGFLVGPMALAFAVALENLKRGGKGSRVVAFAMAAAPGLILLVCLILTKSRSAYIGLFVALLVATWKAQRLIPPKVMAWSALGFAVLVGGLVVGGVATRKLDIQVITESNKSLRYRWEYWVGTWGVITNAPSPFATTDLGPMLGGEDPAANPKTDTFWWGVGPANFAMPYLGHKLPQASEEIKDPHNMVLETWVTAGLVAMIALLAALAIGLREILGPSRGTAIEADPESIGEELVPSKPEGPAGPRTGWLVAIAGFGWLSVWSIGKLNPMVDGDLFARWLILGAAWGTSMFLGAPLWRRRPIPAAGLGVAALALSINLLAAGGIGIPSIAMSLWVLLALGLNLREDRPCGRLREFGGLGPAVILACVWAALMGTFFGAVLPYWRSELAISEGDAAMAARPPAYEVAREAYRNAIEIDHYNVRPWIALADLEFAYLRSPEMAKRKEPQAEKVMLALDGAVDRRWRDPNNLDIRRRQASYARAMLQLLPANAGPYELLSLQTKIVKAYRLASSIYPTSASLRAELALACSEIGMYPDAIREANLALKLDETTEHKDKKLSKPVRKNLKAMIPQWEEKAKNPPPKPPTAPKRPTVFPGSGPN